MTVHSRTYWTDSSIVLAWLAAEPSKWKVFVSNRVAEIQALTENGSWRHIETGSNPADIVSRGCQPPDLWSQTLWWHGPAFLSESAERWPQKQIVHMNEISEARKENIKLSFVSLNDCGIFDACSTYNKLLRVTAYIFRFYRNCKTKQRAMGSKYCLTTEELKNARTILCRIVQNQGFSDEIRLLRNCKPIPKGSKLYTLLPFLDSVSEGVFETRICHMTTNIK